MVCAKTSSSAVIAWFVLYPGEAPPFICADRYSLNRIVNSGPVLASNRVSADSGTISPLAFRT